MTGEIYHCIGSSGTVDITVLGPKLQGAKVIHNHPDYGNTYGDCFSKADFVAFFNYRLKRLEVTSGLGRYMIEYAGPPITADKAYTLYHRGYEKLIDTSLKTGEMVEYEQLKIMEYLGQFVPGLKFKEV